MTKELTQIDKAAAKAIAAACQKALESVAAEFGLTVEQKGGKYDPTGGTYEPKMVFTLPTVATAAVRKDLALYGIDGEYGTEFTSGGKTYRITGVNFRAQRMPIKADSVTDGRGYKFEAYTVQRALGQEEQVGRVYESPTGALVQTVPVR
jgi:hypothetical protein